MTAPSDLQQSLESLALNAGAAAMGFARATEVPSEAWARYQAWLASGRHGAMTYLERWSDIRRYPLLLLPDVTSPQPCSLMVCAFSYFHSERQQPGATPVAMYAHGEDYHRVLRRQLKPAVRLLREQGFKARVCVDSAPLMERTWAVEAGVGFIGRNGLLIVPGVGSWVFLATVVTDAPLEPSATCSRNVCMGCNRCMVACPGRAIASDGTFDARRCLSYLTIEAPAEELLAAYPPDECSTAGTPRRLPCVYGCDHCQRVCPHNAHPAPAALDAFHLHPSIAALTPRTIASLTPAAFEALFADSPLHRRTLPLLSLASCLHSPDN